MKWKNQKNYVRIKTPATTAIIINDNESTVNCVNKIWKVFLFSLFSFHFLSTLTLMFEKLTRLSYLTLLYTRTRKALKRELQSSSSVTSIIFNTVEDMINYILTLFGYRVAIPAYWWWYNNFFIQYVTLWKVNSKLFQSKQIVCPYIRSSDVGLFRSQKTAMKMKFYY